MTWHVVVRLRPPVGYGPTVEYEVEDEAEGLTDAAEIVEEGYQTPENGERIMYPASAIASVAVVER